jgi:hypothetical protein
LTAGRNYQIVLPQCLVDPVLDMLVATFENRTSVFGLSTFVATSEDVQ